MKSRFGLQLGVQRMAASSPLASIKKEAEHSIRLFHFD